MLHKLVTVAPVRSHQPSMPAKKNYLFEKSAQCTAALRAMPVDRDCRRNLEKIKADFQVDLACESQQLYDEMPYDFTCKPTVDTVTLAVAHELSTFLMSGPRFLEHYNVIDRRMTLLSAINPSHMHRLIESFNESFAALPDDDRVRLATVIHIRAFEEMDTPTSAVERALSLAIQSNQPQLDLEEVLAMVDYAHYSTGQFVPINCGLRLWKYHHIAQAKDLMACVSEKMRSALQKLGAHEEFVHHGVLYKGVALANPSGPLRRSFLVPGDTLPPTPHPTSATSDARQSYADPPTFPAGASGRDAEIIYLDTRGIRIHLFNNVQTVGQMEVVLPADVIMTCLHPFAVPAEMRHRPHRLPTYFCKPAASADLAAMYFDFNPDL